MPSSDAHSVYTISPGAAFVDRLAQGVTARFGTTPDALATVTLLLPNRRGCRALREAFLRESGGRPLLLPRIQPIGDIDEDELTLSGGEGLGVAATDLPPAITPLRREILLSRLIMSAPRLRTEDPARSEGLTVDQAARLARELARLLDQVQREQLDWSGLPDLVAGDLAAHWQTTLDFLDLVTRLWPDLLEAEGCLDPQDRLNRLLASQADTWRRTPPADPVIVAGSTGSVPAVRDLIGVVAGLPRGMVVLPGLDGFCAEPDWAAVRASQTHPQYGLVRLLDHLGVAPHTVRSWDDEGPADGATAVRTARARLASELMRPSETSDGWSGLTAAPIDAAALTDVRWLEAPGPQEEATSIALLMREALEQVGDAPDWPAAEISSARRGRTVALATPDRDLARRVAAALRRWNIEVDDSAGTPLGATAIGSFLRLLASAVADGLAPVALLALLKHPLAAAGMERGRFLADIRRLETSLLRGPRPSPGIDGLRLALSAWDRDRRERIQEREGVEAAERLEVHAVRAARIGTVIDRVAAALATMLDLTARRERMPLADLLSAHIRAAESLAATDGQAGADRLWAGDAGDEAARFLHELGQSADGLPPLRLGDYPGLMDTLMAGRVVRPAWGRHPRLAIWGPLEARLQQPDLLILGGLNEGSWPGEPATDPWMSRPMRQQFGLPLPERQIGQAAHDFAQGFCCPEVVLTRSQRAEGTPTVPSRWLLRLQMVIDASPALADRAARQLRDPLPVAWARGLDRMDIPPPRVLRPMPCPPVESRPMRLSVTQVETLLRDPYAVYARHVLGLEALDPIDADPSAADRGQIVHKALELFVLRHPAQLPADPYAALIAAGREAFAEELDRPSVRAFWWPRFRRIARWVADLEAGRRPEMEQAWVEPHGQLELPSPAGPFVLHGYADRIDRRRDGTLEIIDYKTGTMPTVKDVMAGVSPQLALEAMLAEAGGFKGVPAAPVADLRYWQVTGGNTAGADRAAGGRDHDTRRLIEQARAGIERLLADYARADMPYASLPDPAIAPKYNDYLHLARLQEWGTTGREEDE